MQRFKDGCKPASPRTLAFIESIENLDEHHLWKGGHEYFSLSIVSLCVKSRNLHKVDLTLCYKVDPIQDLMQEGLNILNRAYLRAETKEIVETDKGVSSDDLPST